MITPINRRREPSFVGEVLYHLLWRVVPALVVLGMWAVIIYKLAAP